jgi:hypothetical protein
LGLLAALRHPKKREKSLLIQNFASRVIIDLGSSLHLRRQGGGMRMADPATAGARQGEEASMTMPTAWREDGRRHRRAGWLQGAWFKDPEGNILSVVELSG